MRLRHIKYTAVAMMLSGFLTGCFTGVESTPRITGNDLKRQNVRTTPEQRFLSDIRPEPPLSWQRGKRFYVADDKIAIIFTSASKGTEGLAGKDILFEKFVPVESVTGLKAYDIVFTDNSGAADLHYVVTVDTIDLDKRQRIDIPFTVERRLVERVDSAMRGHTYYVTTPRWIDPATGGVFDGKRHVPVKVQQVVPGTALYPLAVDFEDAEGRKGRVLMSIGNDPASTRNFHTYFAFDNPRSRYPAITDATWQKIINSQIATGMTRDECRLALGAPDVLEQIPTTAGIVERWRYDEGIYVIFEDGVISQFRK